MTLRGEKQRDGPFPIRDHRLPAENAGAIIDRPPKSPLPKGGWFAKGKPGGYKCGFTEKNCVINKLFYKIPGKNQMLLSAQLGNNAAIRLRFPTSVLSFEKPSTLADRCIKKNSDP